MNDQELDKSKPHSLQDQELQKILIMLYIDFYSKNVMNKQVYDKYIES